MAEDMAETDFAFDFSFDGVLNLQIPMNGNFELNQIPMYQSIQVSYSAHGCQNRNGIDKFWFLSLIRHTIRFQPPPPPQIFKETQISREFQIVEVI